MYSRKNPLDTWIPVKFFNMAAPVILLKSRKVRKNVGFCGFLHWKRGLECPTRFWNIQAIQVSVLSAFVTHIKDWYMRKFDMIMTWNYVGCRLYCRLKKIIQTCPEPNRARARLPTNLLLPENKLGHDLIHYFKNLLLKFSRVEVRSVQKYPHSKKKLVRKVGLYRKFYLEKKIFVKVGWSMRIFFSGLLTPDVQNFFFRGPSFRCERGVCVWLHQPCF